jgi:outer membrane protein assembly factor BamB
MTWLITLVVLLQAASGSENWPQWRGPAGTGVSSETGLPEKWTAANARWKAPLAGSGASSPIVWGDLVFVTSQSGRARLRAGSQPTLARGEGIEPEKPLAVGPESGNVQFVVEAFRRSDGGRAWQHRLAAEGDFPEVHQNHNMASPSPVTDGRRVYALFATGQLVALDMNGKVAWQRHLAREYGPFDVDWGHGSSPALYRDLLILLCDHKPGAYMVALDTNTGKERWKVDRGRDLRSYSTPIVFRGPAGDELIVNTNARIEGYDPATGKQLWYTGTPIQISVPVPSFEDGVVYVSRGYRSSPYMAIRLGGRGDITGTHVLWSVGAGAAYVSSVVAYKGLVYFANDAGVLTCVDQKTGARVWQERVGGLFFGSPVAGDGKVYFTAETGETTVVQAGRELRILARNRLGERVTASPAIAGRSLFIRSDENLFCIKAPGPDN